MTYTRPDIELWLTGYLRGKFPHCTVTNKEPPDLGRLLPLTKPLIVVRDDSGPRLDFMLFQNAVGVSVLAGTKANDKPANDLAREVAAVLFDDGITGIEQSPVTRVEWDGCNGPYAVDESSDVARRYMTVEYITAAVGY
ncbi:hypothetical protein [Gulosibacter molinativorax]|uniref:Tail terminator n=1 Tax=Gulosibacter molinativorax TaxID=256821 RepID=A0ABT7CC39_9MICO|nr:hypothetical protein [Gulosibacter molinativorax]MDJ1372758.1 hypothetical protein [Gulosibacter molinativorax]QUY63351.1 Hypotetical protein [Gulosibacter molinativorax]